MERGRISFVDFAIAFFGILFAASTSTEVGFSCTVKGISLIKMVQPNWCHLDGSF